jgi:hypothetical protein
MIVAVFRRRLRDGCTFEDFKAAWEADQGFGVPTRVFNAIDLADEREVEIGSPESVLRSLVSATSA